MNAQPLSRLFGNAAPGGAVVEVLPTLGTKLTDFPDFAAKQAEYQGMKSKVAELQAEISAAQLAAHFASNDDGDQALDAAADALRRGEEILELADIRTTLARLSRRLEVAQRAKARARLEYERVRQVRSQQLARVHYPEYRAAVRVIAARLYELHLANLALAAVRENLEAAGVSFLDTSFVAMSFPPAALDGGWGLGTSPGETWIGTARRQGFISDGETLAELLASVKP